MFFQKLSDILLRIFTSQHRKAVRIPHNKLWIFSQRKPGITALLNPLGKRLISQAAAKCTLLKISQIPSKIIQALPQLLKSFSIPPLMFCIILL